MASDTYAEFLVFFSYQNSVVCFRKPSSSASFHYLDADANGVVSQPGSLARLVAVETDIFWRLGTEV